MKKLIGDKYHKLKPHCQDQCAWLISELIKHTANDCDFLLQILTKNIITGNTLPRNLALIDAILDICIKHKEWLYQQSSLIPIIWYTFISLIYDHAAPQFDNLREKEISLCSQMIRERFDQVKVIGRDLIRVLFNVSKIPQFESIWRDIMLSPSPISNLNNLKYLLMQPTPKHILASRLTPEMESWMLFMMKEVKFINVKRYQQWFNNKYLNNPANYTLAPDLIRYICGVWHPSNQILSSDITPRYAQIGWILKTVNTNWNHYCLQALLYDWFFFSDKDNIMNVEPAMLLMFNSLKRYKDLTFSCIQFMLMGMNTMTTSDPSLQDVIRHGIRSTIKILLEKKVILSLDPIINDPGLQPQLRDKLKAAWDLGSMGDPRSQNLSPMKPSQRKTMNVPIATTPIDNTTSKSLVDELFPAVSLKSKKSIKENVIETSPSEPNPLPQSRDEDDDVFSGWSDKVAEIATSIQNSGPSNKIEKDVVLSSLPPVHSPSLLSDINASMYKEILKTISLNIEQGDLANAKALFYSLSNGFSNEKNISNLNAQDIATSIIEVFKDEFKESNPEFLFNKKDSLIHTQIFYSLKQSKTSFCGEIVREMRRLEPSIGFRLLCFLAGNAGLDTDDQIVAKLTENRMDIKEEHADELDDEEILKNLHKFVSAHERQIDMEKQSLFDCYITYCKDIANQSDQVPVNLMEDCALCAETNTFLFLELVPYLFRYLQKYASGNVELIKLLLEFAFPATLFSIESQISVSDYSMFGDSLDVVVQASLEWESFAQVHLWRLISAEFVSEPDTVLKSILPILKTLDHVKHSEALGGIMTLLLARPPDVNIVETLLILPLRLSRFFCSMLTRWARTDMNSNIPKKEKNNSLYKYLNWTDYLSDSLKLALQALKKSTKGNTSRKRDLIRKSLGHLWMLYSMIRQEAVDFFLSNDSLCTEIATTISENGLEEEFAELLSILSP